MKSITIAVLIGCAVAAQGAELPVRAVVLYKHGVGYFERDGSLAPGESARIDFKAEEMNDVLKSLTVNDANGKVTGLRYDSSIPLDRKLAEFPFRIADGQTLSAILDQLKGARVDIEFGSQKISGEIVSARLIPGDKDHAEHEQASLLMDTGELRNLDLSAAASIRFTDPQLQLQFKDYLGALTAARSKEKRSLYIDSTDSETRKLRATYIAPMPAWKSSYRLLLGEAASTFEGWAIVDNTTGEDWTNVRMSLVSGKPISFISDLYNPKYIARQTAELPEDQAIAPTIHNGAIADATTAAPKQMFARAESGFGPGAGGGIAGSLAPPPPSMNSAALAQAEMSSLAQAGAATEIADLFEYSIHDPVTVKKNESAMLPFLQQKISARKLIVYSDSARPNPLNAVELTNDTGRTLDGGPITVYDSGAYAGEALVETVKSGDKRFISYGVDLGTRISTNLNSRTDDVRELHAHDGLLIARAALIRKQVYTIRNVDARPKTLVIEFPVHQRFVLVDTVKPFETATDVYRFEVKVPANGSVDFPVTEENVYDRQTSVSSLTPDSLLIYTRNRSVSDAARKQLSQVADLKTQIAAADSEKRRIDSDVQNVTRDEERNRQNIASLSSVSGQQQVVQDYARRLADQETQISKFRDRQTQLDTRRTSLQTQLDTLIGQLSF